VHTTAKAADSFGRLIEVRLTCSDTDPPISQPPRFTMDVMSALDEPICDVQKRCKSPLSLGEEIRGLETSRTDP